MNLYKTEICERKHNIVLAKLEIEKNQKRECVNFVQDGNLGVPIIMCSSFQFPKISGN